MTDATNEPSLEQINSLNRAYFRAMGRRIAELRNRHEMTPAELARLLGSRSRRCTQLNAPSDECVSTGCRC